jgi:SUMO ligase MMS21 Smc5/6 complex component
MTGMKVFFQQKRDQNKLHGVLAFAIFVVKRREIQTASEQVLSSTNPSAREKREVCMHSQYFSSRRSRRKKIDR